MNELVRKLRRKYHRDIAFLQDLILETIYRFFPSIVLHGGTLIWRCLKSNRLSEDLDFYLAKRDEERIKDFFDELKAQGFEIKKLRIREKSLFSRVARGEIEVRVEIIFEKVKSMLMDYECLDGRVIPIKGLCAEDLLQEKVEAFLKRRKIRDLYDVYFLVKFVEKKEKVKKKIAELVRNFKKPIDEKELEKVILFGYVPKSEEMIEYLKRWLG